jgi:uncharacterized secreted protein with C-terminal beta-propeller domain
MFVNRAKHHQAGPTARRFGLLQRRRSIRTLLIGAAAISVIGGFSQATAAPKVAPSSYQSFASCERFLAYIRPIALSQAGPYGLGTGPYRASGNTGTIKKAAPVAEAAPATAAAAAAAAPVAGDSSSTNTQEAGVDEGDLVENDGRNVYSAIDGKLRITDVTTGKLLSSTPLIRAATSQLILDGKRLLVANAAGNETVVSVYDVTNAAAPSNLSTTFLEGSMRAVRSIDHRARLVMFTSFGERINQQFIPGAPGPINNDDDARKSTERLKQLIKTAPAADWLPRQYSIGSGGVQTKPEVVLPCNQLGRPKEPSGLGLTWIATIDLDVASLSPKPVPRGSSGVVASGGITYASSDTLYVATTKWTNPPTPQNKLTTEVHAFSMKAADGARWLASGSVTGTLLNQFSLSEYDGALRVATTRGDGGFGSTPVSGIQTLMLDSANNRILKVVGEIWGLGTNERIYAVRFQGPLGYVVTFRQVDPLYVLNLENPTKPVLTGELKIPGYSAYLHPIGDGYLLGIGQDASAEGRTIGSQLSLFDVSNLAAPARVATLPLGSTSAAEYNHLAFLWWPKTRDVFLPTQSWNQGNYSAQVNVARVGQRAAPTLTARGAISHSGAGSGVQPSNASTPTTTPNQSVAPAPASLPFRPAEPIVRTMIVADRVVTVSAGGVLVSDIVGLTAQAWVPFSQTS